MNKMVLIAAAFIIALMTMSVTIGRAAGIGADPSGVREDKPFDPMKDPNFEVPYQGDITQPQTKK